ncbi:CopM family metallochaperone [Rhizobium phaseoli]|uniref:CopM family metallochaperone n=1 Tax=Rhizobium phaseoli TaxID=396 RepID=UPI00255214FD|nr:DUF305 domain-containing protein [Rhizobium phaseoli]MDK4724955.1 DUF305 domain-containing protein [Rhizobium phaseoli]
MNRFTKLSFCAAVVTPFALLPVQASAQMAYPDKCKSEAMNTSSGGDMPTGEMTDYQKASMEGMKSMHDDMMQGMMNKDADVAFICGMIAHHMGAISMSEAELKYGDDKAAKAMAKKVIAAQKKEIADMTKWVEKQVK